MLDRKMLGSILKNLVNLLYTSGLSSNTYSSYILPLFFFKWLSDFYSNNELRDKNSDDIINFPKDFSWSSINDLEQNIADVLSIIFLEFEELNPFLKGFFIDLNSNRWKLINDKSLRDIIQEISILNFKKDILSHAKLLRETYDELIMFIASIETKSNSNFTSFTPYHLRKLAVALINPQIEMQIYDPACGSGNILIEVVRHFKEQGKDPHKIKISGQERNDEMRAMATIGLILHGAIHSNILPGSIIESPLMGRDENPQKFDIIITNPPFGVKNWKSQLNKNNDLYQFKYGDPPQSSADYAFIQRVLAALSDKGKAAIIVPHGVLFRGGAEKVIRENVIKDDVIEAIIGLPEKLFYATKISTALIVFNKQKSECRKNNVLFIDASHDYELNHSQNSLNDNIISGIVLAYSNFKKKEEYAQVASNKEIAENDYILAISHYIESQKIEPELNIHSQVKNVQDLEARRTEIEAQMNTCLKTLGIQV
jgi:type I restriction enzyme M protein